MGFVAGCPYGNVCSCCVAILQPTKNKKCIGDNDMNENIIEGQWKQLKGKVKQQWGKLTNDQLDQISGKRDELVGLVQEAYGRSQEEAESEVEEFFRRHS
jgi:uncharacterized protein YjbJ (UPF0337 family)